MQTRLTDEGRTALATADERAVAIERRIEREFTAEERELLRSLLGRAVAAIRGDGTE